ncbi:MAG: FRG domain-containing protein [Candidatus Omnitrophica bacterium]|nr:FRG domain-containing protein [Candidatus Omnitrophota bacterium]
MVFKKISINNARDLVAIYDAFGQSSGAWFFRGHARSSWLLESSFERYYHNYSCGPRGLTVGDIEKEMLSRFEPLSRRLSDRIPDNFDSLSRCCYLQHYGCATRLLDITMNFYVACFFAVHDSGLGASDACASIWCFNNNKVKEFICNKGLEGLYSDLETYKIGINSTDHYFGKDFDAEEGVLLVGNQIDSDHQLEQNGGFLLGINSKIPTYDQIFNLYNITGAQRSSATQVLDLSVIDDIVRDNDVLQIIVESKTVLVDCERLIVKDMNWKRKNLLPRGIKSEFADLNDLFK